MSTENYENQLTYVNLISEDKAGGFFETRCSRRVPEATMHSLVLFFTKMSATNFKLDFVIRRTLRTGQAGPPDHIKLHSAHVFYGQFYYE